MTKITTIVLAVVSVLFLGVNFAFAYDYPQASTSAQLYNNFETSSSYPLIFISAATGSPAILPLTFSTSGYPVYLDFWTGEQSLRSPNPNYTSEGYFELDDISGVRLATSSLFSKDATDPCSAAGQTPCPDSWQLSFSSSSVFVNAGVQYRLKLITTSGTLPLRYCTANCYGDDGGLAAEIYAGGQGTSSVPLGVPYIHFVVPSESTTTPRSDFSSWSFNYQNPITGTGYSTEISVAYSSATSTFTDFAFDLPTGFTPLATFQKKNTLPSGSYTANAGLISVFTNGSSTTYDLIATTSVQFSINAPYINPNTAATQCGYHGVFGTANVEDVVCWSEKFVVDIVQWIFVPSDNIDTYWQQAMHNLETAPPFSLAIGASNMISSSTSGLNSSATTTIRLTFSTSTFGQYAPNVELWNVNRVSQLLDKADYTGTHPNFDLFMQAQRMVLWGLALSIMLKTIL